MLGLCLKDREQLSEARDAFERAIAIAPAFIPAREELAELHRLQDAHPRGNRSARGASRARPGESRAADCGRARLPARRQSRTRRHRARQAQPSVFPNIPECTPHSARCGSKPPRKAASRAICAKPSKRSSPSPRSRRPAAKRSAYMDARLLLAGQTRTGGSSVFRQAAERFPIDPDVLPHYAAAAQRLGHLDDARQALLRYSAARGRRPRAGGPCRTDRRPVTAAERRSRGGIVVSRNQSWQVRQMRRCWPASPMRRRAPASSTTPAPPPSARSRRTRTTRLPAPSRSAFRRGSASDRARRAAHLRES